MKIHSDKLTREDLKRTVPAGTYLELTERGSRKRARGFEIKLSADHGTADAHGVKRRYSTNSGYHGGDRHGPRAATWVEYGDWMVELFKLDRQAIIANYDGAYSFILKTRAVAGSRPAPEQAPKAADRWCDELFPNGEHGRGRAELLSPIAGRSLPT